MLIWGSRGENIDLGKVKEEQCSVCEKKRPYHLRLSYRWFHFYWIFGMVTEIKYFLLCDVCSRGQEIDKKEIAQWNKEVSIPFWRRYGLLIFAVIAISIATLASLGY